MTANTPRILIIAGSDSGGGAGIQADIKTVTMLGGHAMTAITAVTAQNTQGVSAVHPVPTEMVLAQIDAVIDDIGVDAVKIGMIGSPFTALHIAARLEQLEGVPVVFDPVMVATSGATLADDATIAAFGKLMDVATLATPNLPELRRLTGEEDEVAGALKLVSDHRCAVLIKGGHEEGDALADALIEEDNMTSWQGQRIDTTSDPRHRLHAGQRDRLLPRRGARPGPGGRAGAAVRAHGAARGAGAGAGAWPARPAGACGSTPGSGLRLNQVTVTGKDYAKMVDFYRALGLKQIVDSPREPLCAVRGRAARPSRSRCDPEAEIGETVAVYFECDDLDERVERLARSGIPFEHGPRNQPWMWREARLRDPSGNTIFLYRAGEARRFPPWRMDE